jgi:hypothetical protein
MGSIHNMMQLLEKIKKNRVFIIVMMKTSSLIKPRDSYHIKEDMKEENHGEYSSSRNSINTTNCSKTHKKHGEEKSTTD